MLKDQTWIKARITRATKRHPSVTESVSAQMEQLLSGHFSERQLSKTELTRHAKDLLAAMTPPPSEADQ